MVKPLDSLNTTIDKLAGNSEQGGEVFDNRTFERALREWFASDKYKPKSWGKTDLSARDARLVTQALREELPGLTPAQISTLGKAVWEQHPVQQLMHLANGDRMTKDKELMAAAEELHAVLVPMCFAVENTAQKANDAFTDQLEREQAAKRAVSAGSAASTAPAEGLSPRRARR